MSAKALSECIGGPIRHRKTPATKQTQARYCSCSVNVIFKVRHCEELATMLCQAHSCAWSVPVFFKVRHCEELATRQSRGVAGSGRQCAIDRMMLDGHASLAMTVKYIARHNGERDHSP
jgi:hypothetical protein